MSAEEVLREKESNRDQYLQQLRKLLKTKDVSIDLDESFLIKFLRSQLYRVKQTCAVVENYLSNFKKHPEFFENVRFAEAAIKDGIFELIPERNKTGETIGILRLGAWKPAEVSFASAIASTVYGFEMANMDEETQMKGCIEIVDMANFTTGHLLKMRLSEIRLICNTLDGSLPLRWKKVFVVRQNYATDILYGMAKPFLRKEFKDMVSFVGYDFAQLHEMVSTELLPKEFGGSAQPRELSSFYNRLLDFEPTLLKYWSPFKNQ